MFEQDIEGLNRHREQTVIDIKELLQDNKRVACVRYTGYGKSYYIVRKLIEDVSGKVIIIVPNDILKIHYNEQYKDNDKVIILTYQIIKNKTTDYIQQNYKDVSLIIADECHHITATKWTKELQRLEKETNASILGLTATPNRSNKTNVIEEFFNNIQIQPLDLLEGISLGFVPKIKYIVAYASLDDKQDIIDNKITDVDRYKISNLLKVENIFKEEISDDYLKDNLKILVFVPRISNIEEGRYKSYNWFKTIYPKKEINIYSISSKLDPRKNEDELNNFKELHDNNTIDIMISVNKLIEGLHLPTVSIEILLRKTKSSVVYFQQIGRVINSKQPLVFDLINNSSYLVNMKQEYNENCQAVKNLNFNQFNRQKVMYDECIELIYRTKEIEDILKKYKYSVEDIILMNKEYIEKNPDKLSRIGISKKLGISVNYFVDVCKKLNVDLNTNYIKMLISTGKDALILENKKYIEENPKNLTQVEMAQEFGLKPTTFRKILRKLNIKFIHFHLKEYLVKCNKEKIQNDIDNQCDLKTISKTYGYTDIRGFCSILKKFNISFTPPDIKYREFRSPKADIFKKNLDYIQKNPDKLYATQLAKKLNISTTTFKRYLKKYNLTEQFDLMIHIEPILLKHKKYIEENPDNLTYFELSELLGISPGYFAVACKKYDIKIKSQHELHKEEIQTFLISNQQYIEKNPDNLTLNAVSRKLRMNIRTLRNNCKELGIDIYTNYK